MDAVRKLSEALHNLAFISGHIAQAITIELPYREWCCTKAEIERELPKYYGPGYADFKKTPSTFSFTWDGVRVTYAIAGELQIKDLREEAALRHRYAYEERRPIMRPENDGPPVDLTPLFADDLGADRVAKAIAQAEAANAQAETRADATDAARYIVNEGGSRRGKSKLINDQNKPTLDNE